MLERARNNFALKIFNILVTFKFFALASYGESDLLLLLMTMMLMVTTILVRMDVVKGKD